MKLKKQNTTNTLIVYIISFLLFILSFLLNVNTLSNKFAFDDKGLIQENKLIIDGTNLNEIFTTNYRYGSNNPDDGLYRPLVMLTYVFNTDRNILNPSNLHLFNVICNSLNSSLIFLLLFFLSGEFIVAFFSALIFTFHPIHTEVVANISGRPEIMCALFIFLSWILLEKIKNPIFSYFSASIFLFMALLSKETAVMFPLMVIAYDLVRNQAAFNKNYILKFAFLITTVIIYIFIRWSILGNTSNGNVPLFYNNPIANSPVDERVATALGVFLRYCGLLLFPVKLVSDYSYKSLQIYDSIWYPAPIFAFFLIGALFASAIYFRKRNLLFPLSFILFFFPYILISNIFFSIGTIMGERLMYLPSAGFALLTGFLFSRLFFRWRYFAIILSIVILCAYSFKTISRNHDWYDDNTLTKADLKSSPENVKLLANMGFLTAKKGQFQIAEYYYQNALEIYPDFVEGLSGLGKISYDQKKYEDALSFYKKAADISPSNPQARFDYASVMINIGRFEEAETELKDALELSPSSPMLFRSMGNLMLSKGDFIGAINNFQKALDLGGNKHILLNNLAASSYYAGDFDNAFKYVQIADVLGIKLNPDMILSIKTEIVPLRP